jgi:hypothetical protein
LLKNFETSAKKTQKAITDLATFGEEDVEAIKLRAIEENYQRVYKAHEELSAEVQKISFDTPSST